MARRPRIFFNIGFYCREAVYPVVVVVVVVVVAVVVVVVVVVRSS